MPAPISRSSRLFSWTRTDQPRLASAAAAVSPPSPAPAISMCPLSGMYRSPDVIREYSVQKLKYYFSSSYCTASTRERTRRRPRPPLVGQQERTRVWPAPDLLGPARRAGYSPRGATVVAGRRRYMPDGLTGRFLRPPLDCVPVVWPAAGFGAVVTGLVVGVVVAPVAAPFAVCCARL